MILVFMGVNIKFCGQPQFLPNVPTPTVASLGTFGEIPVGHFTGIPQVHIPLHTIKAGNYELPLSLDYHLANVRPSTQCGELGLGWSLTAGGYISRTVRGVCDERSDNYGYYSHHSKMENMTHDEFVNHTVNHLYNTSGGSSYELCADEFSFNFCGYSGFFYLNEIGNWTVVSDDDIRVEFIPSTGFVSLSGLSSRISYSNWANRNNNNRFFNRFALYTPDGCRYEFGGISATDYCIDYYQRNSNDLIATTWKLKKITTTDGRTIEFSYSPSPLQCDVRYVPTQRCFYGLTEYFGWNVWALVSDNGAIQNGRRGFTGYLLFGTHLTRIQTETETVDFHYFTDTHYSTSLVGRQALFWIDKNNIRNDFYSYYQGDPADQFDVFLNKHITNESDLLDQFGNVILSYISVNKNHPQKSIHFDYTYNNRRKLSRLVFRSGAYYPPSYSPDPNYGYAIPENDQVDSFPEYRFKYDQVTMPSHYILNGVDSWGFYNGNNISISAIPNFQIKYPNLYYSKAETLNEITFPTGGRVHFQYELNNYQKAIQPNGEITSYNVSKTSGGLRVKQIDFLDSDSVLEKTTRYYYTTEKDGNISSGITKSEPTDSIVFTFGDDEQTGSQPFLIMKSEGGFFPDLTNHNSPNVGYSTVFEETITPDGQTAGYIRYDYSNYDDDIFGQPHLDILPSDSANVGRYNATSPVTSKSQERGKLLCKSYYNTQGSLVRREETHYSATINHSMNIATQHALVFSTNTLTPTICPYGWITQVNTYSYLPTQVEIKEYSSSVPYTSNKYFQYNDHKLLTRETLQKSDGSDVINDYIYAYQRLYWMSVNHILTPVTSKRTHYGNECMVDSVIYDSAMVSQKAVPFIYRTMHRYNNGPIFDEVVVRRIDRWGNPLEYSDKGVYHTLIWDQQGEHLVAHIINCEYNDAIAALGNNPLITLSNMYIADAYSLLPNSLIYYYEYDENGKLNYVLTPDTPDTLYWYDSLERLKSISYFNSDYSNEFTESYYNYYYPKLK